MIEFIVVLALFQGALALPEQGVFEVNMNEVQNIAIFTKSMFNGTTIAVKIRCNQDFPINLRVSWLLRWTPCAQEYADIESSTGLAQMYFSQPELLRSDLPYQFVKYQKYVQMSDARCSSSQYLQLPDKSADGYDMRNGTRIAPATAQQKKSIEETEKVDKKSDEAKSRKKRQAAGTTLPPFASTTAWMMDPTSSDEFHKVTTTWEDGIFLFIIRIDLVDDSVKYNATIDVRMKGPRGGFLSAIEWPLLPFYGVMCVVYVIFGLIWLLLSACNWRDLLRIQFWIGGVIFLGMLEKAVFFSEHETINSTGHSVRGAMLFGEMVSCLKRTLARMLVIIVSLGFGIVKPRLGPVLHKVLALGGLYFILGSVEGWLRIVKSRSDQSNQAMLAAIPLAVLDAAICWWIFTGLVTTIRTLRLRRNLVKLGLYRHFTNTLIFAVVASVAFMVWSITQHKFSKCLSDWKELWVDEAFWHLLFSIILLVIMILWRPSANNQRYAFSPLMDAADDEAVEPMMNDAFDGMKMRGMKNGSPVQKEKSKADEDLKWIDENIPTSVADAALPSLLDSDEEIMNTKYEMSKME